jgi:hypothetical protein
MITLQLLEVLDAFFVEWLVAAMDLSRLAIETGVTCLGSILVCGA